VIAYLSLLLCSFYVVGQNAAQVAKSWRMIFFVGAAVIVSAIYFSSLQIGVLKSICKFCTSAHLLGFIGTVVLFTQAPLSKVKDKGNYLLSARAIVMPVLLGLMSFGVLAAGQKVAPRKTNNIAKIHQGTFNFDLREVPLIGSPNDRYSIVSLFDYTCPDCHEMHNQLLAARQRLSNSFSIISLPLPLDPRCNRLVRIARPKHIQACDYAQIGLAVRRSGLEAYQKYDQWFFGHPATPPLEEARQEAIRIVGQTELEKNLADPWVSKMIETSVSIYAKNEAVMHTLRVPQLIIGDVVNAGPVRNVDELVALLNANLAKASL
jgi:hypothetical protein